MSVKSFAHKWLCGVAAMFVISAAHADTFPSKPITIYVGFAAGGATDTVARLYAQKLSQVLNTPVIVENRPGANQLPAIRSLQSAQPDGYTLLVAGGSALTEAPAIRSGLGYDPLKDFSLIGNIGAQPCVLTVGNSVPAKSIAELIDYAKGHPGSLNYASSGVGTAGHLEMVYFQHVTGTKMTHIPFKSDAETSREMMAGTVQLDMLTAQFAIPLVKSGKLKGLMITTSQKQPYLPEVPGLDGANVKGLEGLDPCTFFSLLGPAGMPTDVVTRLNGALNKISTMPDVVSRMRESMYIDPVQSTPATFRQFVEKELGKWQAVAKAANLKLAQ
ncbi:Bug family tripartite tricarboxylate transporter substrate binding protein [Burkholderia pyrrocinia]|uniref:Bug family tripartite tricarboxylate transporter substrate binding protein n=1 Tax=Burkholderia pyrrocinia TaxID=60550 RepID=UPI002AB2DACC|nr:tripartite tricarboxylate transporter substrate-binding protein [Burkholderia pyrrocinia]